MGHYWDLGSVASPSLSTIGRIRLDPFQGYAGSHVELHEPMVHDDGGALNLLRAKGPIILHTHGRIYGDLCSILRARIQCAIASVPRLIIAALRLGASQSDCFGGPAHRDLHNIMQGLPRD
jgi:hypothetical protein